MDTETSLSSEKIHEALELLRQAAKEKKDELRQTIYGQYSDLRDTLGIFSLNVKDRAAAAVDCVKRASEVGQEKAKEAAAALDQNVREKPWHYIGGVALGALLLGYVLGRRD